MQYNFTSPCTAEQIKRKLEVRTSPLKFPYTLREGKPFFFKWFRGNRFYLLHWDKRLFAPKQQHPFIGKFVEQDGVTKITGRFGLTRAGKAVAAAFLGCAWAAGIFLAVSSEYYTWANSFPLLLVLLAWFLLVLGMFHIGAFQKKDQDKVLDLIRTTLLGPPEETDPNHSPEPAGEPML